MKARAFLLGGVILAGLFLLRSDAHAATYVEFYFLSGTDGSGNFCMNQGLHGSYHAFDLTKYSGVACGGSGAYNDLVAVRTAGYTASGSATLKSDWYTGEYSDGCDYAEGRLTSVADGLSRGKVRYLHSRYPGVSGYYGTLNLPASTAGTAFSWGVANLTTDSNCSGGWSGYHVHQDMPSTCLVQWSSLSPPGPYGTWANLIHKITYTEGIGCP